jgi:hypothetical protein
MTTDEIFLLIILTIGWATAIVIEIQCNRWHNKHDEAVSAWTIESRRKDKQIEKLENEIKTYKDMERVIKIERVAIQPRELECKFMLHERFVDDTELFKKVITSEVARFLAEELIKDPYLCKVYHDVSYILRDNYHQENIKVRFRMLPYAEGVVWEDIFKEEE